MFDLIFYKIVNKIRTLVDSVNDYSKWKDKIITKEEYMGMYEKFMADNNIDLNTYTNLRGYIILTDVYFKDYVEYYVDRKLRYIKKNLWTRNTSKGYTFS